MFRRSPPRAENHDFPSTAPKNHDFGRFSEGRFRHTAFQGRSREWFCANAGSPPALCRAAPSRPDGELLASLRAFADVYRARPARYASNAGGMNVNHAFSLWRAATRLQPGVVVESGVHRGFGTWLLRQARPEARIFALEKSDALKVWGLDYFEASNRTALLMGSEFQDFNDVPWDELLTPADRAGALVVLDDHTDALFRVAGALRAGFRHLWFDDMWEGSHYSLGHLCRAEKQPLRGLAPEDQHADAAWLLEHLVSFHETPAIFDGCATGYPSALLRVS